jgi:uncharacterized repeat protein (TIGR01451 family)
VGSVVTDSDSAFVDLIHPSVGIAKMPDTQTVVAGSPVTFTIAVTNTGDASLSNVTVGDVLTPNCNRVFTTTLGVGDSRSYTCTLSNTPADFTNTATVTGLHPAGGNVSDADTAFVNATGPAIDIAKTPDLQIVSTGSTVTFTIAVTNTGDVPLTNVAVSDAVAPNCARVLGALTSGESRNYTCTLANVLDDLTNVASASGTPPAGSVVTDSDSAQVQIENKIFMPVVMSRASSAGALTYWSLAESMGTTDWENEAD